jgi:hypothetical protein
MNAPFPLNPTTGQFFGNWTWNGVRWVCSPAAGVRVVRQVFTASGPYMPSPGLVTAVVECVGGGGNGGAVSGTAAAVAGGGGGGSGGRSQIALAAALVAGGVQVTVGQGGAVGPLPPPANDYADGGGVTSFGALCVANGGGGGGGNASGLNIWGWPGLGAPPGVGDLALPGNPGGIGTSGNAPSGSYINVVGGGGGAIMGGGGISALVGVGGIQIGWPGLGPGAGGGGAAQNEAPGAAAGGQGHDGVCIVTEYCWADSGSGADCDDTVNVNARVAIDRDGWRSHSGRDGQDFGDD